MAAHRRIVVASILGIAACGGGDGPLPPLIEADSASQSVSATRGGVISLPSGSSLTVPPGALAKDRLISISVLPALPQQPPSGAIVGVGPAFRMRFSPTPSSSGSEAVSDYRSDPDDFVVELKITNLSVTGLIGSASMADIVDPTGGHHFVGISGTLNESSGVATFT
ncbi:MAG: hypothetical protein ACT443_10535, partial [Gemmatimonadota bacterium]